VTLLRNWLLGIVAAALALSLAQALTPEGAVKRVGRLIGGLVLLLAVLKPLLTLDPGELTAATAAYWGEEALPQETDEEEILRGLIAQRAGAYIVDKGEQLGLTCSATVTVVEGAGGWSVPWSVEVRGSWSAEGKRALSECIAADLDIPADRQTFLEGGT